MRLPFRVLWFLGYHLVLWWAFISALNATDGGPSFLPVVLGFLLGIGLVLQASARLPALFHGLALLVLLPGLIFLAPLGLADGYRGIAMPQRATTVLSATSHELGGLYVNLPGLRVHSYTDLRVRLADGSTTSGFVRPERTLAAGQPVRLHVDPLGLIRPQDVPAPGGGLTALALLVLVLAEVELVSALVRRDGGSFIAASGRDAAARDAAAKDAAGSATADDAAAGGEPAT